MGRQGGRWPPWEGAPLWRAARTPNLDRLAREGTVGVADNVPAGMEASSAVACMSVMGFDPAVYYAGRGPIEATAMGIELEPGQVAHALQPGDGSRRPAGQLLGRQHLLRRGGGAGGRSAGGAGATTGWLFTPGVGFRHILTVREGTDLLATRFTPAHDVTDRPVDDFGPEGPGAALVRDLTERSKAILAGHPVNKARIARGQLPATQIWLFWPGMKAGAAAQLLGRQRRAAGGADLGGGPAPGTGPADRGGPGGHPRSHRRRRQRLRGPDGGRSGRLWTTTTWCSCTWRLRTRPLTRATWRARCAPSSRWTP